MSSSVVVVDTCSLINLALPMSHSDYDHEQDPDPLRILLQAYDVTIPKQVKDELENVKQYNDLAGAAARNLLKLNSLYTVENPLRFKSTPQTLPSWQGLDEGETAGILYSNTTDADYFLCDEFTNRGTIQHHLNTDVQWISVPDVVLIDLVENRYCTRNQARRIIELLERERSWQNQPYVQQLKERH